jgi:poly(beta-D-mannuronate) lyase
MIAPVFAIEGTTYYKDDAKSVADPGRKKADRKAAAPLQAFEGAVLDLSDHYLATGDRRAAQCAMRLLKHWAAKDALLGEFNRQGDAHRRWGLVGLSLAYLIVRQDAGIDPADAAAVGAWLGKVGHAVADGYPPSRLQNNHLYWAAAGAIMSGIAANDRALFDWGIAGARTGLGAISAEGILPLELKRGAKALGYHSFAMTALTLAAEFAAPNGVDLYAENDGALSRLANLILANMDDTSKIDDLAGARQEPPEEDVRRLTWAEPYYAQTKDERLAVYLATARPVTYRHLGNTTLLFGPRPGE